jgi:ABC-type sugar transport system permease subunit
MTTAEPMTTLPATTTITARQRLWALQHRYAPYFFTAPFVILFCTFMIYPLGRSIVLSMHKAIGPAHLKFVGLDNYRFLLFDRLFWLASINTAGYAVIFISIQIPLSLGLALLLNSKAVRGRNFFRFAFFTPVLVGQVFVAVIFTLLLAQRHGMINRAIGGLFPGEGLTGPLQFLSSVWPKIGNEINWIGSPNYAMPAVIIASLWLSVGYGMIYFLAALQAVDRELYEAAEMDGAGKWSQFWNVTLPGIRPVLVFMILVGTVGAFQLFELPYVLFQGAGPNNRVLTIVMYLFQQGFEVGDIGYASAVGWMLVVMIFFVSLAQLRLTRAAQEEDR